MNGREEHFPGGLTAPDGCRTDVFLRESGPGKDGSPMTFDLVLVSGNAVLNLVECPPADVAQLGEFLKEVANEVIERDAPEDDPADDVEPTEEEWEEFETGNPVGEE